MKTSEQLCKEVMCAFNTAAAFVLPEDRSAQSNIDLEELIANNYFTEAWDMLRTLGQHKTVPFEFWIALATVSDLLERHIDKEMAQSYARDAAYNEYFRISHELQ